MDVVIDGKWMKRCGSSSLITTICRFPFGTGDACRIRYANADIRDGKRSVRQLCYGATARVAGKRYRVGMILIATPLVSIDASGEALVAYWFFVALGDSLSDEGTPERRFARDGWPWLANPLPRITDGRSFSYLGR